MSKEDGNGIIATVFAIGLIIVFWSIAGRLNGLDSRIKALEQQATKQSSKE